MADVTGTLGALNAVTDAFAIPEKSVQRFQGQYNIFLKSTGFIGKVALERRRKGSADADWAPIIVEGVRLFTFTFTGSETNLSGFGADVESGMLVRAKAIEYSTGSVEVTLSGED